MKGTLIAISLLGLGMTMPLAAEDVEGYLIDTLCSTKLLAAGPEAGQYHTKGCALSPNCKASGYGVVTADGTFLKFDEDGNAMAVKALEADSRTENLKVSVSGEVSGDTITVTAIEPI